MVSHGFVLPTRGVVLSADDSLEQAARVQSEVIGLARRAEALGFDGVWAGDSVLAKPRLEPLSTLAAVAGATESVTLGTAVYLLQLRNPVHVAHQTATVDQVSGGRLALGVGVGVGGGSRPNTTSSTFPTSDGGRCSTRGSRSSRDSGTTSPSPSTASSSN
jgi:alkanesulfonate monooxygenase SsuD/methylene tetrahydromethanopterin reductase-like flavin-dependent oxidoreductase (luciferase family)